MHWNQCVRKFLACLTQRRKMKEQSSTLETTNPKIVLPNKDLVDVKKLEPKKEVTKEETKLPKPTGWRMLVLPFRICLLYTSPSPRDGLLSRMPSSA